MSFCGGKCSCGSDCNCANGCGGRKMLSDMNYGEKTTTTQIMVLGFAPEKLVAGESIAAEETGGCKCGADCICDPCACGK